MKASALKLFGLIFFVAIVFYFTGSWGYKNIYGPKAVKGFCQKFSEKELTPSVLNDLIKESHYRTFLMQVAARPEGGMKYIFKHETKWSCVVYLDPQMKLEKTEITLN